MIKEFIYYSKDNDWRRKVNVYLPPNYNEKESFPVIYCFDGANLYDGKNSLSGRAWDISLTLDEMVNNGLSEGYIVVGIYTRKTGEHRMHEYSPVLLKNRFLKNYEKREKYEALGDMTLHFFDEVRSVIESNYKTNGVNHILGSSMGGIMSLYSLMKRGNVYRTAGIFSIGSFLLEDSFDNDFKNTRFSDFHKAFIFTGDREGDKMIESAKHTFDVLSKKGVKTELLFGKNMVHTESTWAFGFKKYIEFIENRYIKEENL